MCNVKRWYTQTVSIESDELGFSVNYSKNIMRLVIKVMSLQYLMASSVGAHDCFVVDARGAAG